MKNAYWVFGIILVVGLLLIVPKIGLFSSINVPVYSAAVSVVSNTQDKVVFRMGMQGAQDILASRTEDGVCTISAGFDGDSEYSKAIVYGKCSDVTCSSGIVNYVIPFFQDSDIWSKKLIITSGKFEGNLNEPIVNITGFCTPLSSIGKRPSTPDIYTSFHCEFEGKVKNCPYYRSGEGRIPFDDHPATGSASIYFEWVKSHETKIYLCQSPTSEWQWITSASESDSSYGKWWCSNPLDNAYVMQSTQQKTCATSPPVACNFIQPHETKIYLCQSPVSEWQWITSAFENDSSYGKWWCSNPDNKAYVLQSTQQKTCANTPPFSCVFNTSGSSSSGGGSSSSSSSSSGGSSSSSSSSSSGGGAGTTNFLDIEFLGIKLWIILAGFVGLLLILKKK